ncbi:3-mercaptopyruvate sulfurtransferase [Marinomonas spartinae]|uniref:sulfurtransferase n=1 Tax=Marinomonas spartinae TaxID=1792290 RepID=UPI000808E0E4|nr:sulfurtransferase [Marinomonas spartinae]SBS28309.1 3-mercaptopyruvate sulfurtransferase [Marinomonas spartinae]
MLLRTLISVDELKACADDSKVVILDCRFYLTDHGKAKREYDKGHIPKAIFVDVHHELASAETTTSGRHPLPSEEVFAKQLQQWGVDLDSHVVVYDDASGAIAARAWWMLAQQGIDVRVLDGGLPAWVRADLPLSDTNEVPVASSASLSVAFPWVVDVTQVIENMETDVFQLVDARAESRYQGEEETIDPVAGHVPGALNHPYSQNLDKNGCLKSPEALRGVWQDLVDQNKTLVNYCGSGITACHNVLALNHAGVDFNQVYVGSWSQWSKRMLQAAGL